MTTNKPIMVIKIGGSVLTDHAVLASFVKQVKELQRQFTVIIVHGGGPHINTLLTKLRIESTFIEGLRVTTPEILDVTEMVLAGKVNRSLCHAFQHAGVDALGINSSDDQLLKASIKDHDRWGFTGSVTGVNRSSLQQLLSLEKLLVLTPLASFEDAQYPSIHCLNVNADEAAMGFATNLQASWLVFLSDVNGVLSDIQQEDSTIQKLNPALFEQYRQQGIISGGMLPKLNACFSSLKQGVQNIIIANGKNPHSLHDFFTDQGEKSAPLSTWISLQ